MALLLSTRNGEIRSAGGGGAVWGRWWARNVAGGEVVRGEEMSRDEVAVAWSGTVADGLFEADPRTWGAAGWGALKAGCIALAPTAIGAGAMVALRTHAMHVLSDAPSCRRFGEWCREQFGAESPFRIVVDPESNLTESMLGAAEDHIARLLQWVADLDVVAAIVVPRMAVLPGPVVVDLLRAHAPAGAPLMVTDEQGDPAEVLARLAAGGLGA
ncbi:MAG: hypothetical protein KF745_02345 [Phycisphaeraceae bacterium]|nr:hypothetical protein [Phycisphaeraceae bacterium]